MRFLKACKWNEFVFVGLILAWAVPLSWGQQGFDPDSVALSEKAKQDYNPYRTLYSMNSWTTPVLDHNGKPHKDGHIIQIIADGGNGIQDPPNPDGSPGGDDSMAVGNFSIQYINGEKHIAGGLEPGMFMGMMYFVPYNANQTIYLRIWEGADPAAAEYYQDAEEYTTFRGNRGGMMIALQPSDLDDIDWLFGHSKKVARR